ncbi:MAG: chitobiase/beta-hexosaminidase C-terminal domain-containing protein, partial [Muribaculaceae bacterium]|nr:chitobiase/beta-hexosaminidase C-terminal domain-containing protein [Muribaculaceae bacterium]
TGDGGTATAEAVYKIGIQPVVYSPFPGTIYKGDDEDINVEMFSVTPNAKIYYTVAEGEDNYPEDPTTSSTLYSEPIPLETGKTYNFKAIAVLGSLVTTVTPGTFTVQAKGTGWLNVKEMNEDDNYSTANQLDNPVQVVYMSTWRNNGTKPEFCFVRDNSGYGLVYFGGSSVTDYNDYTKFNMGDWLAGGTVKGKLNVWDSSFINELGTSGGSITGWPSTSLGNTAILPEETTNKAITDGWTYNGAYTDSEYEDYIDPDKNLFGHYVHMRKNTISNVSGAGGGNGKHAGIITDQSGVPLNYYDGFYLFSGYNNDKDYDQTFFNNIQSKGGTFDVYAIVQFYGPNANNSSYSNAPYEIFPIDFEWIYKPLFNIETGTYYEPQTISLTCETEGAQIWYKTSEMEAYELYTGPFEVDATTTIETYSTLPSKYNDVLESVINSITVTIGTVDAPVITEPSVVKTVDESVTTDITCTTEGATIYYTTDGSDPKTSETRIEYTLGQQLTFDETTTVRAIAMQDGYYSVEAESRTYTFVKSNGIEYTLVTNVNQLNENSVYVIVNKANNMAMSTNQKTNNRGAAGVMFKNADKTIVYGNDDLAQFTLKKTGNNWYIQTNNSNENGYLSVGNGNTLLTSATADGNAEATITIDETNANVDKANEAHISFIYNNETTRYLRYWNRDLLFNTYATETNAPVFLYYIKATPLATIEKEGEKDAQYTIADELVAVHAFEKDDYVYLWCKDQGNISIAKTENTNDYVDYMRDIAKVQTEDWDQSNWVVLKFKPTSGNYQTITSAVNHYIKPAMITGTYSDDVNYTITMPDNEGLAEGVVGAKFEYSPNWYCTANFLTANHNGNATGHSDNSTTTINYFFMNPKIQEVCEVTFAVWNGNMFVVPAANGTTNDSEISGAFNVEWTYNAKGDVRAALNQKTQDEGYQAYKFRAIVQRPASSKGFIGTKEASSVSPADGMSADDYYIVYPVDLDPSNSESIVTGINNIEAGNGEVKSIKYVNVAGIVSDRPFQGVNIVVTEYTDGTRTTSKMLCK